MCDKDQRLKLRDLPPGPEPKVLTRGAGGSNDGGGPREARLIELR